MSSLSITLRYRPVRIGWCVAHGDMPGLRAAMRRNFTLWGGRFNPIISIDDVGEQKAASQLVRLFRTDALYPVTDDPAVTALVESNPHLRWPSVSRSLVLDRANGKKSSTIADLLHPIERIYRETYRSNPAAEPLITLHEWDPDDPLADIILAMFGGVPPAAECAEDYLGHPHDTRTRTLGCL